MGAWPGVPGPFIKVQKIFVIFQIKFYFLKINLKLFPASKQLEIVPLAWMVVNFVALGHFGFAEPFG